MFRPVLCFLTTLIINLSLFGLSFHVGFWLVPTYYAVEGVTILVLLLGKTSRPIKIAALLALGGAVVSLVVEAWLINQMIGALIQAASDGLEP